jgi:hypothetical protein
MVEHWLVEPVIRVQSSYFTPKRIKRGCLYEIYYYGWWRWNQMGQLYRRSKTLNKYKRIAIISKLNINEYRKGLRDFKPVEMEVTKSKKQEEAYDFSHGRFTGG